MSQICDIGPLRVNFLSRPQTQTAAASDSVVSHHTPSFSGSVGSEGGRKGNSPPGVQTVDTQLPERMDQLKLASLGTRPSASHFTTQAHDSHMIPDHVGSHDSHMTSDRVGCEIQQIDSVLRALNSGTLNAASSNTIQQLTASVPSNTLVRLSLVWLARPALVYRARPYSSAKRE